MDEFTRFAIPALEGLGAAVRPRRGLAGVVDFKFAAAPPPVEGVFVGSASSDRISCVVYHPAPIDEGIRPQLMLLCHLINPTLDLGQLEFTHDGARLVSKVTQCAYAGEPANERLIKECVETALKLMREHRACVDQVIRGDLTAANAFHTRGLAGGEFLNLDAFPKPDVNQD